MVAEELPVKLDRKKSISFDPEIGRAVAQPMPIPTQPPAATAEDEEFGNDSSIVNISMESNTDIPQNSDIGTPSSARTSVNSNATQVQANGTVSLDALRLNAKRLRDPEAVFDLAKYISSNFRAYLAEGEEYKQEGLQNLIKIAKGGHLEANFFLGNYYDNLGQEAEAYRFYYFAAKRDHVPSCRQAAKYAEAGTGCKKSERLAVQLYLRAATGGDQEAMFRIGQLELQNARGRSSEVLKAAKWFKRACAVPDGNHSKALFELVKIYEVGYPPDIIKDFGYARNLLLEAVRLRYPPAIFRLGYAFEHELLGFKCNPVCHVFDLA
jgi:TPR repeat protein